MREAKPPTSGRDAAPVVIVGAGPAGLAAAHALKQRKVPFRIVERGSDHAHVWRNLYDSLRLHTGRHLSALPGLGFPAGTPLFPSRVDFIDYLDRYRRHFGIDVETGMDVTSISPAEGSGWRVVASDTTLDAADVIVATGIVSQPVVPSFPGQDRFGGRILHSSAYHRPDPFADRRVLVVGCGNSGGEIAAELAHAGVETTIAVRTGAHVVPLSILGIPTQYVGWVLRRSPAPVRDVVVAGIRRLTDLRRGPPVIPRPPWGTLERIPLIGFHLADAIRAGDVRLASGVAEIVEGKVRFTDGTVLDFDDIILATGFRPALQPLGPIVRTDAAGFALRTDRVTSADRDGLYFVGHNYDSSGGLYNIGIDANLAADRIAASRN